MPQIPNPLNPGDSLGEWSKMVSDFCRSINPRPSSTVLPRVGSNGTSYTIISKPGSLTGGSQTPFQVVTVSPDPAKPGDTYQCYVWQGNLRKGLSNQLQEITGLTLASDLAPKPPKPPTPTPFLYPLLANDAMWLEIQMDQNLQILSCAINTWGISGTYDPNAVFGAPNAYMEIESAIPSHSYIKYVRYLLAYAIANTSGNPVVTQLVDTDLRLSVGSFNGYPSYFPETMFTGYPPPVTPPTQ